MDLTIIPQTEVIKTENDELLVQNRELRRMLLLLQENVDLRTNLEKLHSNPEEIQRHMTKLRLDEEDEDSDAKQTRPPKNSRMDGGHMDQTEGTTQHGSPGTGTDSKQLHLMQQIIGEIAFQLDRRILTFIFPDQTRLYGVSVANIPQKIIEAATDPATGNVDEKKRTSMTHRYDEMMKTLKQYGYDMAIHPTFSENMVNAYGIMKQHPPPDSTEMHSLCDPENLKKIAYCAVPSSDLENVLILLKCLCKLSKRDGKPLFRL
ncbi:speriolin-like protein isoform X2 [Engystomops pustulosus]|uniref:speriolin-like protein isoform X2 n=1 Tax=Engystomops pustulosus TaxID=76066 RepID=UPI003AFB1ACC